MRMVENYEFDISTTDLRNKFYATGSLLRFLGFLDVLRFDQLTGEEFTESEGWLIVRYMDE